MANRESGFTFLELILVLAIMSILTVIIIPLGDKWIQKKTEADAIQSLILEIQSVQSYAIANNSYTWLSFNNGGKEYISFASPKHRLSEKTFPDGINMLIDSSLGTIGFTGSGRISKLGTVTLKTPSGLVQLRFQFEHGRVIVGE
ncbi:competence type IV pilus minor pilin ComGD [Sporosarcina sp. FA9]|uniref:competence type IV pilus minor pilin ComGD n=1 Tax=Sporosarcina sp. FA9 TaxID=3413030 RepID=UPI003F65F567